MWSHKVEKVVYRMAHLKTAMITILKMENDSWGFFFFLFFTVEALRFDLKPTVVVSFCLFCFYNWRLFFPLFGGQLFSLVGLLRLIYFTTVERPAVQRGLKRCEGKTRMGAPDAASARPPVGLFSSMSPIKKRWQSVRPTRTHCVSFVSQSLCFRAFSSSGLSVFPTSY